MHVNLQYGTEGIDINIPFSDVRIFRPKFIPGLPDEQSEFRNKREFLPSTLSVPFAVYSNFVSLHLFRFTPDS